MEGKKITEANIREHIEKVVSSGTPFEKQQLYDILMEEVYHTFTSAEIKKGFKKLDRAEQENLLSEADYLNGSKLLEYLLTSVERQIYHKIYFKAETPFSISINKMGLWTLQKLREELEALAFIARKSKNINTHTKTHR